MNCQICKRALLNQPAEQMMQACLPCAKTSGIQPMPSVARPAKPCPTCNGLKFLRAIPREYSAKGSDYVHEIAAPMKITYPPRASGIFFNSADPIDITHPGFGTLEIYICYGCGRAEWFCPDVAQVPVHPHLMTDVVDYESGTPYR